jgi:hypothetical protein
MDAKITLSFNAEVIANAKQFADKHNISLSRLTEFIYSQLAQKNYQSIDELPIADWVSMVAEGEASYQTQSNRKTQRKEYLKTRK